jgi:hypothetical protein
MGSSPFPEVSCRICGKSIDLCVDLHTDENGKSVHEGCYLKQITQSQMRALRTQWQGSGLYLESPAS